MSEDIGEDTQILAPSGRPAGRIQPLPQGACEGEDENGRPCRADKKHFVPGFGSIEHCMKCGNTRRTT
jgi:hypothetical protein